MSVPLAIPLLAALSLILLVFLVRFVPAGQVWTVHRRGHFVRALAPGWRLLVPGLEHVQHRVSMIGHHVELDTPASVTHGAVYYQILDPQRAGDALDDVDALVQTEAQQRLQVLLADRSIEMPSLGSRLKHELNQRLGKLGLLVIRCQVH